MSVRLVTAHRSAFIRDVLRLSGAARGVHVVGESASAIELVNLCRIKQPDVVYAEDSFADGTQIESVLVLLMETGARVIVVCDDPSPERLTRILALGAHGYLRHDTSPEQVLDAVESVAGGAAVLGPAATATMLDQWRRLRGVRTQSQAVSLAISHGLLTEPCGGGTVTPISAALRVDSPT